MSSRDRHPSSHPVSARFAQLHDRLSPLAGQFQQRFEIDTRALAAVRIGLGLVLLIDLVHRFPYIQLFYTNQGVYPLTAYEATYSQYNGLSLHALSGELWVQQLLFVIAGLFALAFLVGYRTRLVGAVSLILLFSLHARNPAVLNGGDRLFRVLLFVALVTPLGERWSIDALRRGSARATVASVGTAALLAQPLAVFTASAVEKYQGEYWFAGDALTIAMANDVMTIFLGNVLFYFPTLMTLLNYGWVVLLAGAIPFLFLPVGRIRALAALAYMSAFVGMLLTMTVGLFPLLLAISVTPYLTTPFWEFIARRLPDDWGSWTLTAAMLGPLGRPPMERRLLAWLRNRGHSLTVESTLVVARSVLTVAGLLVLIWIVLFTVGDATAYDVPDRIDHDHLDQQRWGLYAPDPSTSYSWYIVEGRLANGSTINVMEGGEVDFDRPPDASAEYATFRHRKYMQSVRRSGKYSGSIATSYVDWACKQSDAPVEKIRLIRMYQPSPINGEFEDPERITVIERECSVP